MIWRGLRWYWLTPCAHDNKISPLGEPELVLMIKEVKNKQREYCNKQTNKWWSCSSSGAHPTMQASGSGVASQVDILPAQQSRQVSRMGGMWGVEEQMRCSGQVTNSDGHEVMGISSGEFKQSEPQWRPWEPFGSLEGTWMEQCLSELLLLLSLCWGSN